MSIVISSPLEGQSRMCEPIIRSLPEWFGIESAIVHYVEEINRMPTFLAIDESAAIGFITICRHFVSAAEIYVMAVRREYHRRGVGRLLIARSESWLRADGVRFFQVKTLSPAHSDSNYAKTRLFYENMGFEPLEEFKSLWGESNPCLLMIKHLNRNSI